MIRIKFFLLYLPLLFFFISCTTTPSTKKDKNLIDVTENINKYTIDVILPELKENDDLLKKLLKIVNILLDTNKGISKNKLTPNNFMSPFPLFFSGLSKEQKKIVKVLKNKYMTEHPAGIFFGPSANDIVQYKFAFGCSHYARVFMAVVKSLKLINNSQNMRYAISCLSEDYNNCLLNPENHELKINGHQFVLVRINDRWYGINTNYSNDYIEFPECFSLENINLKEKNISIQFKLLPKKIFLLRKIGKDCNDDCDDYSLNNLMNIYRSGEITSTKLNWEKFIKEN